MQIIQGVEGGMVDESSELKKEAMKEVKKEKICTQVIEELKQKVEILKIGDSATL